MPLDPTTDRPAASRRAARVLVIDPTGHVLLFRGYDPARPEAGEWWITPGGGLDDGESFVEAARRELREETGLVVDDLGPPRFVRRVVFDFEQNRFDQTEQFFCVLAERFAVSDAAWTDLERRSVRGHRWWSLGDIRATDETIYPEQLADELARILDVD